MARVYKSLMKESVAGIQLSKTLLEMIVCPLSKQPLRYCEKTESLVSDAIGVSFPIVDGIPCLVPQDGKVLDSCDTIKPDEGHALSLDVNMGAWDLGGLFLNSKVNGQVWSKQ